MAEHDAYFSTSKLPTSRIATTDFVAHGFNRGKMIKKIRTTFS